MARPGLWRSPDQHCSRKRLFIYAFRKGVTKTSPGQHFFLGRNEEASNGLGESYTRCSGIPIVPRCPDVGLLVDVWVLRVVTLVFK